jgi:hemerythrin-like metal-binding protein
MPLIEWRDEYRTGSPSVDHEHEELVNLINEAHDTLIAGAAPDETVLLLGEIYARIASHFALEEKLMREHRYEEYAPHKEDHEHLLDILRDIMEDLEAGGEYEAGISVRLRDWFVEHFRTHDARLHQRLG